MSNETVSFWIVIKNLLYIPAIFVGISMQTYFILAVFLIIDVITGAWRSGVIHGGSSVTSFKAINGMISKFLFLLIPIIVAYMGHGIGIELVELAQGALGVLVFATGYSIIGNIYAIRTGKAVAEFDAVKLILTQIESILKKLEDPNHK